MKKPKYVSIACDRLRNIMLSDRLTLDADAISMLRADLVRVLSSYFEYDKDNVKLDVYLDQQAKYRVDIAVVADGVLPIKSIK